MVDFALALKTGLSGAALLRKQQVEIRDVISKISQSIEDHTNGLVTLVLAERALKTSNELLHSMAFMLSKQRYQALLIKGKKYAPHELVEIARWAQDSIGYPVRIGLSNDEYICADKTSLEKVLLGVLVNSNVGLVVQSVHENQLREASTIAPASSARKPASVPDARSIANKVSVANIQGTIVDEPFAAFTLHKVATKRSSARKAIAAKPSAKAAPKTQARPAAKSVTKTGAKQAAKTTTRPVAKSASKPATKSVAKPAAKSVAKPAAKPAVKPIAKTAAKVISARH